MIEVFLFAAGLIGLVLGGDMLVRGAVSVARSWHISPMVIGLTLVGFGTSAPELVTSLQAAFAGAPGLAVGNVVGSNIGNVLLILGCAAVLAPIVTSPQSLRRDGTVMLLASLAGLALVLAGQLGRVGGLVLLCALAAYLATTLILERRAQASAAGALYAAEAESVAALDLPVGRALLLAAAGLAITVLGARALVFAAIDFARMAGVSETVIGLTIVAIGTSLPELVTAVVAVRKGQGDVAFGNVLGSNIFNILGILGVTALVRPLEVPNQIAQFDIWVMCGAAIFLVWFARTGWRMSRREGAVLLGLYALYLFALLRMSV